MTLQEDDFFDEALTARRSRLRYRLVVAGIIGLCFTLLGDWLWPIVWYGFYCTINLIDHHMLGLRMARSFEDRRRIVWLPCLGIAASNLMFVALAIRAPGIYGPWGVVAFGFLVGGITLYSIMAARASRQAFLAALVPLTAGFVALPFLAYGEGGGWPSIVIVLFGAMLTLSAAVSQWRDSATVRRSEMVARLRAEAGDAAKTRFLAMVSHDLRTPLSAIRAGAERLARGDGRSADDARLIEDAAVMMRRLLDDLLDMFKTEAGQMVIASEAVELRTLCADLVRFWQPTASDKGLVLQMDDDGTTPDWVMSDATRLRQILNNLLSNALKFTASGQVTLSLKRTGDMLKLIVSDTGTGLSPQDQTALFQPYVQGSEGAAHGGGTGLGLVISRELARAMGGDLTLSSTQGHGAAFTLTVTCRPCDRPDVLDSIEVAGDLSVLIVDDHPINRKAMALMIEGVVPHPVFAASGEEALTLLMQQAFDVVLMDVNMPGLDGWETTRRLRAAAGPNRATPVVAVTGSTSDADIAACQAAGMEGWVAKPVGRRELFAEIDRVLTVSAQDCADAA